LLAAAIALSAFAGAGTKGRAQAWPAKPIRVIVPLTAGSATDVMARLVMDQVSARLGQPIIVENRPGAGNTIGMSAVAKADPDGHTILANSSTHTVTAATRSNLGFEMTDLAAIVPLGNMPVVMVVNPAKGYKTLTDFVAGQGPSPAWSTTPRPAREIPPISTASGSDCQQASRRCICRSRARRKR
jgi:tripartite-type tricarboxylate transporter receptor subunit TctC